MSVPRQAKGEHPVSKLDNEQRNEISGSTFAFPEQRKEPLEDANHVRNAIARFDQVKDVSDVERDEAWKRIKAAAKKFGVEVKETSWREIGKAKKA
jgi:cell division protein FtsX